MGDGFRIHRFIDAGEEPSKLLIPIEGYEKKDLVSLKEAIEPIKNLLHNTDRMVDIALQNSNEPPDGITTDESAAIHIYTIQWPDTHDSLYKLLNRALRDERRNELKPWFSYLKLILTALYKLPPIKKTLWRAVRGNMNNEYKEYKIWWGFSSCTESRNVADQFLKTSEECTLFKIECISGRCIESYSYFKEEKEILLMPGTYLRILGKRTEANGLHIIELLETKPPYQLIAPPFTSEAFHSILP
ncbi:unnamed protein product [Rotaria socialis]